MDQPLAIYSFLAVTTSVIIVYLVVSGRRSRVAARLAELSDPHGDVGVPQSETASLVVAARLAKDPNQELKKRLVQAGLYKPGAHAAFVMMRVVVGALPLGACLLAASAGTMTRTHAIM